MMCSDGATDGLADKDLESLLGSNSDPQQAAEAIVAAAQVAGSRDNITCLTIFVT
jgi:protein phosphatase